jgi:hypothetical protein
MRARAPIQLHNPRRTRHLRTSVILLLLAVCTACKTSQEAVAAGNQLSSVSQQLTAYYVQLQQQVTDTITLNQIQNEVMPDPDADPKLQADTQAALETTRQELDKRVAMAKSMGNLAAAYAALAGSKAADDIATAASGFATQCRSIGPLTREENPAVPDLVHQAAQMLIDAIRERKLRQSSGEMSKTIAAVADLFKAEEGLYKSINDDRIKIAAQTARHLVAKENVIDMNLLLAPALKPFDLAANLPTNQLPENYRRLARNEIDARMKQQITDFAASTAALGNSLQAASDQVAKVADKHHHDQSASGGGPAKQQTTKGSQ